MADYDPNNPFAFSIELEGAEEFKKSLASSEQAYIKFDQAIGYVVDGLKDEGKQLEEVDKQLKRQSKTLRSLTQLAEAYRNKEIKSIKVARAEYKKYEKERKELQKVERQIENKGFFRKHLEVISDKLQLSRFNVGDLATTISVGLVGALYSAAKAYLEFFKQTASLNATMGDQPKLLKQSIADVQSLTGYLDYSRDEIISVTKAMGDLHMSIADTPRSVQHFRDLKMNVLHLSKAMDVSTHSVIGMFDSFDRVYKLPHHRIRGIASAMKAVQESTSMTGDEVVTFTKSLDDMMSRMRKAGGEAKADVTRDMTTMVAVMKDMGIEVGQELPSLFAEALKIDSDKGQDWLAFVSRNTGKAIETIRNMLESGDVVTPTKLFIQALKKEGPELLRLNEEYATSMTGMSHSMLTKMMKLEESNIDTVRAKVMKAEKDKDLHEKRAKAQQHRLSMMWNQLHRTLERIWLKIGEGVVRLLEKLGTEKIMRALDKAITWLEEKIAWLCSKDGLDYLGEKFKSVKNFILEVATAIWNFGGKIKWLVSEWTKLDESTKSWVKWAAGTVGLIAVAGKLLSLFGIIGGKVMLVVGALIAMYMAAKRIADWVSKAQADQLEMQRVALDTNRQVNSVLYEEKGGKWIESRGKSRSEKIGSMKALMGSQNLFTLEGKINTAEVAKRAQLAYGEDKEGRENYIQEITLELKKIQSAQEFKSAVEGRKRDVAAITSTAGTVPATTAVEAVTPVSATATEAQVIAVQNTGSTDNILMRILDVLIKNTASGGTVLGKPPPSSAALSHAVGG